MAAIYFALILAAVAQTLALPQDYGMHDFGYGQMSGGYGDQMQGYDEEPVKTVVRPPTRKVTREQQEDQTVERQTQRQILHRQRQTQTRSEQTHRHDHHVEKLHKHILHQTFNPHTITTVNRNHHHHDRNEFVTHIQDVNQPIIHKYVRPSQETRRGQTTQTKSEERVEEEKVLTPITKPVKVIKHPAQYAAPMQGYH